MVTSINHDVTDNRKLKEINNKLNNGFKYSGNETIILSDYDKLYL